MYVYVNAVLVAELEPKLDIVVSSKVSLHYDRLHEATKRIHSTFFYVHRSKTNVLTYNPESRWNGWKVINNFIIFDSFRTCTLHMMKICSNYVKWGSHDDFLPARLVLVR